MINVEKAENCCGCTACASICPRDAISMRPDSMGFLYPIVDVKKCIECGLCIKVCAFKEDYDISSNLKEPLSYGVRHKDLSYLEFSRSGAAFIAISDKILENGGVVYGVGYADHFRVVHKRAVTKEERDEFRGSKYVQSDLTGIFRQVLRDLKDGHIVLFSGTPCQTAGLSSYIGKLYRDNLYLVDIVCHGVPSPNIWRDYLTYLETKFRGEICSVNFRDKRYGWKAHVETYKFSNGKYISSRLYTDLFYKHIMLRPSCSVCHFTNVKRPSDITLADFWGWEKTGLDLNKDDKGISLVLVNTLKGNKLFNEASSDLVVAKVDLKDCLQSHLKEPTLFDPRSKQFEQDYIDKGFGYVVKKYLPSILSNRLKSVIGKIKRSIVIVLNNGR